MTKSKSTQKRVRGLEVLQKLFAKYWHENDIGKKADNMLMYGKPLVFNRKTGKWSNSLPLKAKKK